MELSQKLESYFETANNHVTMIQKALKYVQPYYPLQSNFKEDIDDDMFFFALDSLVFRFAKLQDWLGQKIFKTILQYEEYPTADINFLEVIKVLEKEKILDLDMWSVFRGIRNDLSHDYPDYEKIAQNINFVIAHSDTLIDISKKLENQFLKIKKLKQ